MQSVPALSLAPAAAAATPATSRQLLFPAWVGKALGFAAFSVFFQIVAFPVNVLFIFALLLPLATGIAAHMLGRSFGRWLLLGFVLPVVVWFVLAALGPASSPNKPGA